MNGNRWPDRLILFAHGSRDPRWRATFEKLTADLSSDLGPGSVRLAYMEFAAPTLLDVVEEAARDGVARLRLLPLFLSAGGHVLNDIPPQVEAARSRHPEIEITVLPPIGENPRFAALLREIAIEAAR